MDYAPLGTSATTVSRIGFGCAAIGGYDYGAVDDRESIRAVRRAVELGVTLFDTADVYGLGHAEEILGRALAGGAPEVIIATKVGVRWDRSGRTRRDLSPAWIREAVAGSLRRLRAERIGLYQLHWPDPARPMDEAIATLAELQREGKILHIGCCNYPVEDVRAAQRVARIESYQVPFSLIDRTWEPALTECAAVHRMAVLTYNSLGQGLLSGKYLPGATFAGTDLRGRSPTFAPGTIAEHMPTVRNLAEAAGRRGATAAQAALAWVLASPLVTSALVGAKTARQVEENAAAPGVTLDPSDMAWLDRAAPLAGR